MSKKIVTLILFMLIGIYGMAQKNINNYKYVVVPLRYEILKTKDQYRLNTLTRYLFKQEGFVVLFDEEQFPIDLIKDRCNALYVNVDKAKGGFLATKLEIYLNDCFGKEVFKSEIGSSRLKDFKKAYAEALREAFVSIKQLEYKYEPIEIKIEENKKEYKNEAVEIEEKTIEKEPNIVKVEKSTDLIDNNSDDNTLYAQEKAYGYQLVDATPKVVIQLLSTTAQNVFLVRDKNAIVYKEDGFWYYSENDGELKESKILNIKF